MLAFLAGVTIGALAVTRLMTPAFPSHWYTLVPATSGYSVPNGNSVDVGRRISVSYTSSVMFGADIPIPDITALSGQAKFLPDVSPDSGPSAVGYVITVSFESLDRTNLPQKYKQERIVQTEHGPVTLLPLDEATYEVYFDLRLLDRDEFELMTTYSPKHTIRSGKTSQIQGQTDSLITSKLAAQTDKISLHMTVVKCLSCRSE